MTYAEVQDVLELIEVQKFYAIEEYKQQEQKNNKR